MATAAELTVDEEMRALEEVALARNWQLKRVSSLIFQLGMKARDDSWFWLQVECDRYRSVPPAWHWLNVETGTLDEHKDIPKGGQFFHVNGVICAPWNRLAYQSENPKGPHPDWQIGDWQSNSYTRSCKTLGAMALRIFTELRAPTFQGRMGGHA